MDPIQTAIFAALIVAFLVFKRLGQISSTKAREMMQAGAALIDVRSPGEFASGHLPAAKNIPVGEIGSRLDALGAKESPIIVYCASGTRSAVARAMLKSKGFRQVYNLGAMSRW